MASCHLTSGGWLTAVLRFDRFTEVKNIYCLSDKTVTNKLGDDAVMSQLYSAGTKTQLFSREPMLTSAVTMLALKLRTWNTAEIQTNSCFSCDIVTPMAFSYHLWLAVRLKGVLVLRFQSAWGNTLTALNIRQDAFNTQKSLRWQQNKMDTCQMTLLEAFTWQQR